MVKRLALIISAVVALLLIVLIGINLKKGPVKQGSAANLNELLIQARDSESKNELLTSKGLYQKLVNEFPNSGEVMNWQKKVEELNIKLLFSPTIIPGSKVYQIKPADTLGRIAKEFKTTTELIMKSNNLASDKISPGRKIKVWTLPFSIVVDKSQNILILKTNEDIIKTYIVSTGKNNSSPTGNFKIVNKLINPTWFKAGTPVAAGDPENILGSRWLGFDLPGFGIHGTTEPQSLGRQATQGCVRMSSTEVEELYSIVPIGAEVTIVD